MMEEPYVTIQCDRCSDKYERELSLVGSGSYTTRHLEKELKEEGWIIRGMDEHICPFCVDEGRA
jgi:hypothetical protein